MVQRKMNMGNEEPEQRKFLMPSEGQHLLQVVDILDSDDQDIIVTKLEVCGGDEEGRTMLHRVSLDTAWKGFFLTRLFLKAVSEPYKGPDVVVDSDNWIGRQFYATVIHNKAKNNKTYANIDEFNFDKAAPACAGNQPPPPAQDTAPAPTEAEQKAWDDDA